MTIRPVRTFPDPCLKVVCVPVGEIDSAVMQICQDLAETMRTHERCVGLAAPQLGIGLRILALDVSGHPKGAILNHGPLVLINPKITEGEGFEVGREGCLSLPDVTANVGRRRRIAFQALMPDGSLLRSVSAGFEARAIQHEVDHLDGILILDRVASSSEIFRR
ncbi:MAG: peptide deformylase [Actinomycetota bacterium]